MSKYDDLKQFSEFPTPSYDEWRAVTEKSLKGKSFDTLLTKLMDEIVIEPMYQEKDIQATNVKVDEPGQYPYTRGTSNNLASWKVSQELTAQTPELLNEVMKHDLARGQNVVHLLIDEEAKRGNVPQLEVGTVGVPVNDQEDIEAIFAGFDVTEFPLHIDAGEVSTPIIAALSQLADGKKLSGIIGADPLHQLAKSGQLSYSLDEAYHQLANAVKWAKDEANGVRTVLVQTYAYHNGGASAAVELAAALSTGAEYVRALIDRGLTADEAGEAIAFGFSIGTEFFTELTKIRVARTLWAAIMKEFGAGEAGQKMYIHARTSAFTKTARDIYVNMLRGTSEAFAAAAAGVQSLHVSPFDDAVQEATPFSRRIARNTSLILQEESHIDKTIDPSGGSWYVEHLTDELAQKAWLRFQEIERAGGIVQALENGDVQRLIEEAWGERVSKVERRKDVIVGVNQFVNLEESFALANVEAEKQAKAKYAEKIASKQTVEAAEVDSIAGIAKSLANGSSFAVIHKKIGAGAGTLQVQAVPQRRLAEPFEQLQADVAAIEAATNKAPTAYLLGMGKLAQYKARADFIQGFFQSGGFTVKIGDGEEGLQAAAKEDIVVLCGQDTAYEEEAEQLIKTIKANHANGKCFIAGKLTQGLEETLKAAGLDDSIHVRTNVYNFLKDLQMWLKGGNDE